MRNWINLPRREGVTSRQAHVDLPEGTYERELGREGFFGPASHMYHRRPPTGWTDWDGPLRPRAFDLTRLETMANSPWNAATVLHNPHMRYRYWRTSGAMNALARNADGDDLLFIHHGTGALFCDYGHLRIEAGDYIVLPRGTLWRTEFEDDAAVLLIEATNGAYSLPDKGLVGPHAIFDPAMLDTPALDETFLAQQTPDGQEEVWRIEIKRGDLLSTVTYPYNPLDAVGWHGNLAPVRINVRDLRALVSPRYHLPPSAHTTFVADRFVVCTFVPRPIETDPDALKIPFFHNNDDYDEVIFYHRGDFFSRDDIDPGMVTFHPAGFTHGPHPGALQGMLKARKAETDEYAVMVDTRDALTVGDLPAGVENPDYVMSWKPKDDKAEAAD